MPFGDMADEFLEGRMPGVKIEGGAEGGKGDSGTV